MLTRKKQHTQANSAVLLRSQSHLCQAITSDDTQTRRAGRPELNREGRSSLRCIRTYFVNLLMITGLFTNCASIPKEAPLPHRISSTAPPFIQEVYADEPLAHWRLTGPLSGAIKDDADGALLFKEGQGLELDQAEIGGSDFSVELWLKNARGTALTYCGPDKKEVFVLKVDRQLSVHLFDEVHSTDTPLDQENWYHIGISWRGSDGELTITINGQAHLKKTVSQGKKLPFDGRFVAGGQFSGGMDEVAVFNTSKHPSHWLHRYLVSQSQSAPSTPTEWLPIRLVRQSGHTSSIEAIAWSPDGSKVATGSLDETMKIWDSHTGQLLYDFPQQGQRVTSISWSPDGSQILMAMEGVLHIIQSDSGKVIHRLHEYISKVLWSPDGTRFATTDNMTLVFDARSGKLLTEIYDNNRSIRDFTWSPDGSKIATAGHDGIIKIWDSKEPTLYAEFQAHSSWINGISWSGDGQFLATASKDQVALWNAQTGKLVYQFTPHNQQVRTVLGVSTRKHDVFDLSWSPDGTKLATSGADGSVKIWDAVQGKLSLDLKGHQRGVFVVEWSADGQRLATGGFDFSIQIWDTQTGEQQHKLISQTKSLSALAWSPNSRLILTASEDKTVKLWDSQTGSMLFNFTPHVSQGVSLATPDSGVQQLVHRPMDVAWSPDGGKFVTAGQEGIARVWDLSRGGLTLTLERHLGSIDSIAWSRDGTRIVTASSDASLRIWNSQNGALLVERAPHSKRITSVEWSPDSATIATASDDQTAAVIDGTTGDKRVELRGHTEQVTSVAWSPDGLRLATASMDGTAKVWDPKTGQLIYTIDTHSAFVHSVAWSPDGRRLISGGLVGTTIWDSDTGTMIQHLKGKPHDVEDVSWSLDGKKIAAVSGDGSLKIWRGDEMPTAFIGQGNGEWLSYNEQGFFGGSIEASSMLAVVQGSRVFSFEQLAPSRNRPDQVLKLLHSPELFIEFYKILWLRRLKQLSLSPEDISEDFSSAPTVRMIDVGEVSQEGKVTLSLAFSDRLGLKGYRVYVNGVPEFQSLQPLSAYRQRVKLTLQLSKGKNTIEVKATNTQGIDSLRATQVLEYEGKALAKPKLYFLGFGVSDYEDDQLDLQYAHQDVLDLEVAFAKTKGEFEEVRTLTFTNQEVNDSSLQTAKQFLDQLTIHDTLVMFIAGHGVRGTDSARTYYYLDHDAQLSDLAGTAIPFDEMEALLYETRARKKLFLLDTCESGDDVNLGISSGSAGTQTVKARSVRGAHRVKKVAQGSSTRAMEEQRLSEMWFTMLKQKNRMIMRDLTRRSGAIVLASSLGKESSLEASTWRNGAFTEEILRALQSPVADLNQDGKIEIRELVKYVTVAVPELTKNRQHPNVERDNPHQYFTFPLSTR